MKSNKPVKSKKPVSKKKIRVLLAKAGLDGHNRGLWVVARALTDAGMEVIYLGLHLTPQQIADAAVQEDVDIVGLSFLSDAHRTLAPKVVWELRKRGAKDMPVVIGGFIPPEDVPGLMKAGVAGVFSSGTRLVDIVDFIRKAAK